jgi:hypothetical protein
MGGGVPGLLEPFLPLFRFLRDVPPERKVACSNHAGRALNGPANEGLRTHTPSHAHRPIDPCRCSAAPGTEAAENPDVAMLEGLVAAAILALLLSSDYHRRGPPMLSGSRELFRDALARHCFSVAGPHAARSQRDQMADRFARTTNPCQTSGDRSRYAEPFCISMTRQHGSHGRQTFGGRAFGMYLPHCWRATDGQCARQRPPPCALGRGSCRIDRSGLLRVQGGSSSPHDHDHWESHRKCFPFRRVSPRHSSCEAHRELLCAVG